MTRVSIVTVLIACMLSIGIFAEESGLSTYVQDSPRFSFGYPKEFVPKELDGSTEVARYAAPNMFKVPVLVAHVTEAGSDQSGQALAAEIIDRLKAQTPGVYGFKVTENREVALSDGSPARFIKLEWKWVNGTPMETASVVSIDGEQKVALSATAFASQQLSDVLAYLCMTLKMS